MRGVAVGDGMGVAVDRTSESGESEVAVLVGREIYGVSWPALVGRAAIVVVAAVFAVGVVHAARKIAMKVTSAAYRKRW
jgi:hypothetical protein